MFPTIPLPTLVRSAGCAAAAALLGLAPAMAQEPVARLSPGARIRLVTPSLGSGHAEATFQAIHDDTLVLVDLNRGAVSSEPVHLPVSALESLDVSIGTRSNSWSGARTGAIVGAALVAVVGAIGAAAGEDCSRSSSWCTEFGPENVGQYVSGVMLAGLAGGLMGAAIGSKKSSHVWEPVDLRPRQSATRRPGELVLATVPLRF
ncbi:MAG: hypothetical protein RRA92_09810 [Gemmatimonadota bacterium]|nr:hypothetical protein [Gemmatimonadota bacterium]